MMDIHEARAEFLIRVLKELHVHCAIVKHYGPIYNPLIVLCAKMEQLYSGTFSVYIGPMVCHTASWTRVG